MSDLPELPVTKDTIDKALADLEAIGYNCIIITFPIKTTGKGIISSNLSHTETLETFKDIIKSVETPSENKGE